MKAIIKSDQGELQFAYLLLWGALDNVDSDARAVLCARKAPLSAPRQKLLPHNACNDVMMQLTMANVEGQMPNAARSMAMFNSF